MFGSSGPGPKHVPFTVNMLLTVVLKASLLGEVGGGHMTGVALPQPRTRSVSSGQLTAWPGSGDPLALLMQTLPTPGLLPPAVPTSLCAPCPQL